MKKLLYTITTLAFLLLFFSLNAQSTRCLEKKVKKALQAKDYSSALLNYQILLEKDPDRVDVLYGAGEAARMLLDYELAETYYSQLPDASKKGPYANTDFYLASTKKALGKYQDAASYFQKFLKEHPNSKGSLPAEAQSAIEDCAWAAEKSKNPYRIETRQLGGNINTIYPDLAPLRYADKLYFTSTYIDDKSRKPVTRIFSSIKDYPASPIGENPSEKGSYSAHTAFNANTTSMYYTICQGKAGTDDLVCEIYFRKRNYEGDWDNPKKLPRHINLNGYTATQPTTGIDRALGKEALFFVSDRPGGMGKMDIWCSLIERDGTFGEPFPLPLNTQGDDITPFFHQQSQTLFFSSNGLPNFGGYDIFRTSKDIAGKWPGPENMGYPLNTSFDEFYFTFHSGANVGYFSSDRTGFCCPGPEGDKRNNDIYEARFNADLDISIFNALDSSTLSKVKIELIDAATGKIETSLTNPDNNKFFFPLDYGKDYQVTAYLKGFVPFTTNVNTREMGFLSTIKIFLYLEPTERVYLPGRNEEFYRFLATTPNRMRK